MNKNSLIELTNKLYRLTLLFPKKEPLRYKIRETADEILANFVNWEVYHSPNPGKFAGADNPGKKEIIFAVEKDLEVLDSYFEIAKWQNWVSYFDILEIQEKYDKLKYSFKKGIEEKSLTSGEIPKSLEIKDFSQSCEASGGQTPIVETEGKKENFLLDSRKEKILKILKEKNKAQVWEIKEVFLEVSKRTLRRDFEQLLKQGLVERIGERNNTFYQLKKKGI